MVRLAVFAICLSVIFVFQSPQSTVLAGDSSGYRLPNAYPNAWRGRMVSRRGLFNVDRAHWGNGVTPIGGQVLIAGFNTFGQVAPYIWGPGAMAPGAVPGAAAPGGGDDAADDPIDERAAAEAAEASAAMDAIIDKRDSRIKELRDLKAELCAMLKEKPAACASKTVEELEAGEQEAPEAGLIEGELHGGGAIGPRDLETAPEVPMFPPPAPDLED